MESVTYGVNLNQNDFNQLIDILHKKFNTLSNKYITGILVKKLPNADILHANKPTESRGKTTHIAFTTKSRYFFNDILGTSFLDSHDDYDEKIELPIKVENSYSNSNEQSDDQEFIETHTVIWRIPKKDQNQLGLSKTEVNGDAFQRFREDMYTDDFLIVIKCTDSNINESYEKELYTILIKPDDTENYELLSNINTRPGAQLFEIENPKGNMEVHEETPPLDLSTTEIIGENIIYYGVPGTGKSYKVNEEFEGNFYRATFYEDYSYADFVGQVAPVLKQTEDPSKEDRLVYEFVPGDFAKVLKNAIQRPSETHNFVIEELNRANTAAVFGDIFQLLDREKGISKYTINNEKLGRYIYANADHAFVSQWLNVYINENEIRIPNNLNIIATMNTSDQNIHPLDTAFTRRWDMEYIPVDFNKLTKDLYINGLNIRWKEFAEYVNTTILSLNLMNSEDKQLGPFFATEHIITDANKFANKVLVYLWKDVFKHSKDELFDTDKVVGIQSLLKTFNNHPLDVFNNEFKNSFGNTPGDEHDE
ncbi:AAA family ATPase [Aquibacillus sediminis]|uniref:AAA family ATPase n=1 Tax=Aquibacillus sediminis TaxID=2574734 RepID=UPI00110A05E8|nr:AAA family ATPase [Aquibacillus sediminis]